MERKKQILIIIWGIFLLVVLVGLIIFLPSFFEDEFYFVQVTYSSGSIVIEPSSDAIRVAEIKSATDISITFTNKDSQSCEVAASSKSFNDTFLLEAQKQYGVIVPKEHIHITFCDQETDIEFK